MFEKCYTFELKINEISDSFFLIRIVYFVFLVYVCVLIIPILWVLKNDNMKRKTKVIRK